MYKEHTTSPKQSCEQMAHVELQRQKCKLQNLIHCSTTSSFAPLLYDQISNISESTVCRLVISPKQQGAQHSQ